MKVNGWVEEPASNGVPAFRSVSPAVVEPACLLKVSLLKLACLLDLLTASLLLKLACLPVEKPACLLGEASRPVCGPHGSRRSKLHRWITHIAS